MKQTPFRAVSFFLAVLLFFFVAITQTAQAITTPLKKKPQLIITYDQDKNSIQGHYQISAFDEGRWHRSGKLFFAKHYKEKRIQYTRLPNKNGAVRIRLTQVGGGAAHLDSVIFGGQAPVLIDGNKGLDLTKVSKSDFDVLNTFEKTVELEFPRGITNPTLAITARVEAETISKEPFKYPPVNTFTKIDKNSSFYIYDLGSNEGSLSIKGDLDELSDKESIFKEYTVPASGHPEGFTYAYVMNDDENLYAVIDLTGDNTMDGDKDYGKVFVKSKDGVKEFKISEENTVWGQHHFLYTDKVAYQHKYYEFKIPFKEIGVTGKNEPVQLAFSVYGTMSAALLTTDGPVAFGNVNVGSTGNVTLTLLASNALGNNENVALGSSAITGADASMFGNANLTCGATIAAGSNCTHNTSFTPTSAGAKTSTLTFNWTGPGGANPGASSTDVALSGTGIAVNTFTLSVNMIGADIGEVDSSPAGISCPGGCSATYNEGTNVTLTVNDIHNSFTAWGGACEGVWSGGPCTLAINGNTEVDAIFGGDGPELIEPVYGATLRTVPGSRSVERDIPITFKWYKFVDPDGDIMSYKLWICDNKLFEGCDAIDLNPDGALARIMGLGAFGAGFVMLGFVFTSGGRRKIALMMALAMIITGGVVACNTSDSADPADSADQVDTTDPVVDTTGDPNIISYTATLSSGFYYWRVTAVDPGRNMFNSEVRWFVVGE